MTSSNYPLAQPIEKVLIMLNKLVVNAEIQHRALKLRIYPTKEQEILINKTFGCC